MCLQINTVSRKITPNIHWSQVALVKKSWCQVCVLWRQCNKLWLKYIDSPCTYGIVCSTRAHLSFVQHRQLFLTSSLHTNTLICTGGLKNIWFLCYMWKLLKDRIISNIWIFSKVRLMHSYGMKDFDILTFSVPVICLWASWAWAFHLCLAGTVSLSTPFHRKTNMFKKARECRAWYWLAQWHHLEFDRTVSAIFIPTLWAGWAVDLDILAIKQKSVVPEVFVWIIKRFKKDTWFKYRCVWMDGGGWRGQIYEVNFSRWPKSQSVKPERTPWFLLGGFCLSNPISFENQLQR